ncbi:B-cell antigen receptor complex-associated protein beta chain-like [Hemiscyllium ocellatum]|uniref:B-cell antigen receptor complex-associated protein beta chain-like n=1 Tax=Hemiscyllium ocellatum TaxID=170820 RepID=UPI0029672892|nr:B-cell antigen receptor complex-associated protein beta chain-like [Hemiscyllium ocellatum]
MARSAGKPRPVSSILFFILSITTGALCQGLVFKYSVPYQAVKLGKKIKVTCSLEPPANLQMLNVKWYKFGKEPIEAHNISGITTGDQQAFSWLYIANASKNHSGIYYCNSSLKSNLTQQCGTEINVITRTIPKEEPNTTYTMKDMLILIQGVLLILCLTLPGMLFLKNNRTKKTEEIETYHMYEGLEVMQTAMYEDIGNVRPADAKWTVGEQPKE